MRRLVLPIVVLLAGLAVIAARGVAGQSAPATPTPTSPSPAAAQTSTPVQTATPRPSPSPRPTFTRTPPVPAPDPGWYPIDRAPKDVPPMQSYVMDLDTEGLFALLPEANRDWVARVVAWTPANEAVVQVGRSDGAGGYRVYAGGPKQAFRLVYRGDAMIYGASVSPDGSLLALAGQKTVVVTLDSGQVVAELGQTGSGAMWSADGRFMAVTVGAPYSTVVWDSRTGERLQLEGLPGAWSHRGHYLAYFAGSDADLTLTVRNFDDGQEFRIQAGSGRAEWSLDDRYLAANATAGEHTVVNIFDMTGKDPQVRIHAAAFGDWLDSRTLFFSGNYCSGFDIFTVKAEGTDLVNHTENEPAAFEPVLAPAGKGIFYAHTKLLRIGEGSVTIPDTGASLSAGNGPAGWSPDGRYVVLSWIGGRCGPCMGMDAPEPPTTVEVFD